MGAIFSRILPSAEKCWPRAEPQTYPSGAGGRAIKPVSGDNSRDVSRDNQRWSKVNHTITVLSPEKKIGARHSHGIRIRAPLPHPDSQPQGKETCRAHLIPGNFLALQRMITSKKPKIKPSELCGTPSRDDYESQGAAVFTGPRGTICPGPSLFLLFHPPPPPGS